MRYKKWALILFCKSTFGTWNNEAITPLSSLPLRNVPQASPSNLADAFLLQKRSHRSFDDFYRQNSLNFDDNDNSHLKKHRFGIETLRKYKRNVKKFLLSCLLGQDNSKRIMDKDDFGINKRDNRMKRQEFDFTENGDEEDEKKSDDDGDRPGYYSGKIGLMRLLHRMQKKNQGRVKMRNLVRNLLTGVQKTKKDHPVKYIDGIPYVKGLNEYFDAIKDLSKKSSMGVFFPEDDEDDCEDDNSDRDQSMFDKYPDAGSDSDELRKYLYALETMEDEYRLKNDCKKKRKKNKRARFASRSSDDDAFLEIILHDKNMLKEILKPVLEESFKHEALLEKLEKDEKDKKDDDDDQKTSKKSSMPNFDLDKLQADHQPFDPFSQDGIKFMQEYMKMQDDRYSARSKNRYRRMLKKRHGNGFYRNTYRGRHKRQYEYDPIYVDKRHGIFGHERDVHEIPFGLSDDEDYYDDYGF